MARARTNSQPNPGSAASREVVVRYDLFDLPTAFHKAGLAGLILLIDSLKARRKLRTTDRTYELTPTTATITFTEPLVTELMDDLYDAKPVEIAVKKPWRNAKVVRPPTASEKEAGTPFVYRVIQPKGQYLRDQYPDEDGLWLKLWRDMLWNIPRGRPTTREPFNQRAEGKPCKEGPSAWADLLKVEKARARNSFLTGEISSAMLPCAQAVNAEGVPFEGRAEQNLLLQFWPLAVVIYVPETVERDGTTELPALSYSLAVPEVSNLQDFLHDYPSFLNGLSRDVRGYRPAQAVIDLPAEGALVLFDNLASLTQQDLERGQLRFSISGVDFLHLVKEGNNVKAMAAGRISPNTKLLSGYRAITSPRDETMRYHNPLFRRALLVALLEERPWYQPMAKTFASFEAEVFIRQPRRDNGEAQEKGPPQFPNDAAKKLRNETKIFTNSLERMKTMPEAEKPKTPLPVIINRVVRTYLLSRTTDKTGIKLDAFETDEKVDWSKVPGEFNDAKQKLAQSLFLEFRSRKEQAFVDHFAQTFLFFPQHFNEPDRLELADVLVNPDRRDDLKTLTLLALSANS